MSNKNFNYLTGKELAMQFNKIFELKEKSIINENIFNERINELLYSLANTSIETDIDKFILDLNNELKNGALSKETLEKILFISRIKKTYSKLTLDCLIQESFSDVPKTDFNKKLLRCELKKRGFNDTKIITLEKLSNIPNAELLDLLETHKNDKFIQLKCIARGLDFDILLKIKKLLKLSTDELLIKYTTNKKNLLDEYEHERKERSIGNVTKKSALKSVTKGKNIANDGLEKSKSATGSFKKSFKKNIKVIIITILILVLIAIAVISIFIYKTLTPSNSKVESYVLGQLKSEGIQPQNMEILSSSKKNKNEYVVTFSFNQKEKNAITSNKELIQYTYTNNEWLPGLITNISSTISADKALDEGELKSLVSGKIINGITINLSGLKLGKPVSDLTKGIESVPFTYNQNTNKFKVSSQGTLNYKFTNGSWSFNEATGVQNTYEISKITNADMISAFIAYQNSQGNTISAESCKVSNVKDNSNKGTASATITVENNNTTTLYAVNYIFNTNVNPTNNSSNWIVSTSVAGKSINDVVTISTAYDYLNNYLQQNDGTALYQISNALGVGLATSQSTVANDEQLFLTQAQNQNGNLGVLTMMADSNGQKPIYSATLNGKNVIILIASTLNMYPTNLTGIFVIGTDGTFYTNEQVFNAYNTGNFDISNLPAFLTQQIKQGKGLTQTPEASNLGIGETYNGVFVWSNSELKNSKLNPIANNIILAN